MYRPSEGLTLRHLRSCHRIVSDAIKLAAHLPLAHQIKMGTQGIRTTSASPVINSFALQTIVATIQTIQHVAVVCQAGDKWRGRINILQEGYTLCAGWAHAITTPPAEMLINSSSLYMETS